MAEGNVPGSFRDPAGFLFSRDGIVYRQVNQAGRPDYDLLVASGLCETLLSRQLLIPHENIGVIEGATPEAYTVIKPKRVPFISYPHSWCFSQLKDAALATLEIQERALAAGMSLKDASAYNIQFVEGTPLLIDTLSFERLQPGPWVAYRQFCRHFYAPLAMAAYTDESLARLSQIFIDGVPLRTASRILPPTTWLRRGPLLHLHLHARAEDALATRGKRGRDGLRQPGPGGSGSGGNAKHAVLASLKAATRRLTWRPSSAWSKYYEHRESYSIDAIEQKTAVVAEWLDAAAPSTVWDLGANTGRFSRLASERGILTMAFDQDAACVELMYLDARARGDRFLLPLVMDLANPSPSFGWAHEERTSLADRGPADMLFALALLHHLAIGNNVPFDRIAEFFRRLSRQLVIEFIPKDDPMVSAMLASRADVFSDYSQAGFESVFTREFSIVRQVTLRESGRVLYWMQAR